MTVTKLQYRKSQVSQCWCLRTTSQWFGRTWARSESFGRDALLVPYGRLVERQGARIRSPTSQVRTLNLGGSNLEQKSRMVALLARSGPVQFAGNGRHDVVQQSRIREHRLQLLYWLDGNRDGQHRHQLYCGKRVPGHNWWQRLRD